MISRHKSQLDGCNLDKGHILAKRISKIGVKEQGLTKLVNPRFMELLVI
jgi:hypothetical protein